MKFYVETKDNKSERKGPIDSTTGWPTLHSTLIYETNSKQHAIEYFNKKFPNNVLAVLEL